MSRPVLRPGLQILRRDPATIQLGLDWPGLAAVGDSAAVRAVLASVDGFRDVDGVVLAAAGEGVDAHDCEEAVALLLRLGALVDRPRTERVGPVRGAVDEGAWRSWWLMSGPDSGGDVIADRRRACQVDVVGEGVIAAQVRRSLAAAGLGTPAAGTRPDLVVLAADGVPDRQLADEPMQDESPHLWVSARDLVGVLGPLVLPGRTACLRCADLARSETDPHWPTLVAAATSRSDHARCDPLLGTVLGAWAAQEVAVWAGGTEPSTAGAVIEIPLGLGPATTRQFAPHPACGCGWSSWRDTIGA